MATTPKLLEAASKGGQWSQGGLGDDGPEETIAFYDGKLGSENADSVTGAGDSSAPMDSANNLKQIAIALHALDAGECNVDICAQNSPPASPEPVTYTGWGSWEVVLGGHSSSPANTGYVTPSSFQIVSAGADAGGGDFGHADVLFGAADNPPLSEDLGIAWVSGDGGTRDHGNDVVLITNLTGVHGLYGDHGSSILEFSVENLPNNSPDPAPHGFGIDRGHMASSFELTFATQTTFPQRDRNAVAPESLEIAHEGEATKLPMHPETTISSAPSPDQAVTWTAIAMAESGGSVGSYSDYSLYDLIV